MAAKSSSRILPIRHRRALPPVLRPCFGSRTASRTTAPGCVRPHLCSRAGSPRQPARGPKGELRSRARPAGQDLGGQSTGRLTGAAEAAPFRFLRHARTGRQKSRSSHCKMRHSEAYLTIALAGSSVLIVSVRRNRARLRAVSEIRRAGFHWSLKAPLACAKRRRSATNPSSRSIA
jgi:hypothetical protein